MNIRVRYFASVREMIGRKEDSLELDPGATVAEAIERLAGDDARLRQSFARCLPMVNLAYVEPKQELQDGDELALIPPVSGGGGQEQSEPFRVTADPLDAAAIEALVASPAAGAVALFVGSVRDHARGRSVERLVYEAYEPAAVAMLAQIGREIEGRWSVERVAIVHRIGSLGVGEASVVIGVSSGHRAEAFDACRYAIERIKEIVPIWKKEHYADGSAWIGSEADYQREIGRLPVDVAREPKAAGYAP
jgi:MoaE-MoaD fusion protein